MWFVGIDLSSAFSREPRQVDLALLDDELRCTFCQAVWPAATEVLARDRNALVGMFAPLVPGTLEGQVWAIDGPQGVAEAGNDARRCERVLRTPGRTPGVAPSHESTLPFAGYIRSSVDLFAALLKEPRFRLAGLNGGQVGHANLFEVFPGAEWGILAGGTLPAKGSVIGRVRRRDALDHLGIVGLPTLPTHDQNDALISAYLAWCTRHRTEVVALVGDPPTSTSDGSVQEGHILHLVSQRFPGGLRERRAALPVGLRVVPVKQPMPTYRGNRGNLLQHWILAELTCLIRELATPETPLCYVDAHAMSPFASRHAGPGPTAMEFDVAAANLPGEGSPYELAWGTLRQGRCHYPSSAALVRELWPGPLDLVLCETNRIAADEIAEWQRGVNSSTLELHRGDWRTRFSRELPRDRPHYQVSFDPYTLLPTKQHGQAQGGYMWPEDIIRAAAAMLDLGDGSLIVQFSTYSARWMSQADAIKVAQPIFGAVGLDLAAIVRADEGMMSMVFARNAPAIRSALLPERFAAWLARATSPRTRGHRQDRKPELVGDTAGVEEPTDMTRDFSGFVSGDTRTTQIGYVNRNRQRCGGHRGVAGTDHGQRSYRMDCLACGHTYGANGTDVFQRRCPRCGGGLPGIAF